MKDKQKAKNTKHGVLCLLILQHRIHQQQFQIICVDSAKSICHIWHYPQQQHCDIAVVKIINIIIQYPRCPMAGILWNEQETCIVKKTSSENELKICMLLIVYILNKSDIQFISLRERYNMN